MREALEQFLASRGYAPSSLTQRRSILGRFVLAFDPAEGTDEQFLTFWASTEHLAPASRRATLQAVSGFLDWCIAANVRETNPARLVRSPSVPQVMPKTLTDAQLDALRDEVAGGPLALPVELMVGCGLRVGEVRTCRRVDDWLEVTGKGGRVAMVPLTDAAIALWPADGDPWPLSTNYLYRRVRAALAAVGAEGLTPHALRRTCATRLMQRAPLSVVQAIMRHSPGSSTTLKHYAAVTPEEMRAAVA